MKTVDGSKCLIERDESNWLRILKDAIADYMANRFVSDKESVLSFCELAPCFKKLQVAVNTFIHPVFHFSWIISYAELPEFGAEIQEFLLELIPDPEAIMEECDTLGPEPIVPEVLTPSSYEPEALVEAARRERKMRELEAEISQRAIRALEAQLQDLRSRAPVLEAPVEVPVEAPEAPVEALDVPTFST